MIFEQEQCVKVSCYYEYADVLVNCFFCSFIFTYIQFKRTFSIMNTQKLTLKLAFCCKVELGILQCKTVKHRYVLSIGSSPLWISICISKFLCSVHLQLYILHLKDYSLLWIHIAAGFRRLLFRVFLLLQILHWKRLFTTMNSHVFSKLLFIMHL